MSGGNYFPALARKAATTPRGRGARIPPVLKLPGPHRIGLTPMQARFYRDPARFRVEVAGRRSGKTHEAAVELLVNAARTAETVQWYVAPTYKQAKLIMWAELRKLIPPGYIADQNDTELALRFVNGSLIALKGAEHPDSLRGPGVDFLVMDEFAWIDAEAWYEVLRPMLARGSNGTPGRAIFKTTPRGFNWAYDLWLRGKEGQADWSSHTCTTAEAGLVPPGELEAARRDMDPRLYRQEFEASFEHLGGRVYSSFRREAYPLGNLDADIVDDGKSELLIGMDFNVNPMSAVIATQAGDQCLVYDSIELMTSNTEEMAQEIRRRYPTRTIIVCPDPSARARKTSAPVGRTDLTILQAAGFQIDMDSHAPPIVDRVNNTNANLGTVSGLRRVRIHPRNKPLIKALDGLTYKDGTNIPDKALGLDHFPDAFGYLLWQRFNRLAQRRARVGQLTI